MPSGSVPMSLHGDQANVFQGEELEEERKTQLTKEIVGLIKKKNYIVLDVQRLLKTHNDLTTSEQQYKEELSQIRAKEMAEYEEKKSHILDQQKIRARELDSKEQKLGETMEEILDIYEYLEAVQDDIVWESLQNDTRDVELSKREYEVTLKEKTVDFNAEQAQELLKQAQRTLDHAKSEDETVLKEKERWSRERFEEKKRQEILAKELEEKELILKGRKDLLVDRERSVNDRERAVMEKEELFAKAEEYLAQVQKIKTNIVAREEYLEKEIKIVAEQRENLASRARSLR